MSVADVILKAMREHGCDCPEPTITLDEGNGPEWSAMVSHDDGCPIVVRRGMGNGAN